MKSVVAAGSSIAVAVFAASTLAQAPVAAAQARAERPGIATVVGLWKDTDAIHKGCRSRTAACHAYKVDLQFSLASGGRLRADMVGRYKNQRFHMVGLLKGRTWTFKAYIAGVYEGFGSFDFSADFRSFRGVQWNADSTHHTVWTGRR